MTEDRSSTPFDSSTNEPEEFDPASIPDVLPVLPLRDSIVLPYIIAPLSVHRPSSLAAVDQALAESRIVLLTLPGAEDQGEDETGRQTFHGTGIAALIMRMLKLPEEHVRVLVQGLCRTRVQHISQTEPFVRARVAHLPDARPEGEQAEQEIEVLMRSTTELLEQSVQLGRQINPEVMVIASNIDSPGRLADLAANNLDLEQPTIYQLLEEVDPLERLRQVHKLLGQEVQLLTMQHEIAVQTRDEIDRSQRDYFLRQQIRAIQEQLGEGNEVSEEIEAYRQQARDLDLSDEAGEEAERQLRRLERAHPDSAEGSVIRNFLDWLLGLPWGTTTADQLDLARARRILDEDHDQLSQVKERILEFLAVRALKPDARSPILCLLGPPGVGKTSLGRSVARALGRKFARISLGGVRDEAEIRGHRRTYIGALPGRILQELHRTGTDNPVFILDEVDKLGADFRGDPSSALLEVLDPEQNGSFRDHFLGLEYDLSQVLFLTTANLLDPIPPAFRDRLEVLRIPGYTLPEKVGIASHHLIPRQLRETGLAEQEVTFPPSTIRRIVQDYTREPGLRELERTISRICRKLALQVAQQRQLADVSVQAGAGASSNGPGNETSSETAPTEPPDTALRIRLTPQRIQRMLGPADHHQEDALRSDRVGIATGLAWTAAGGDLLLIEAIRLPGKGRLQLTGQLGDVMQESAQAALSHVRRHLLGATDHEDPSGDPLAGAWDVHIHVPAGSIPKDGPSAGITIATALLSLFTGRAVRADVAMTGELTLRGDVLPVGGLREKLLAAETAGIETVLIPANNTAELSRVPTSLRRKLNVRPVGSMQEVADLALKPIATGDTEH